VSARWRSWPGACGALGHATTATLGASGLTAVAVDRNERGLRELPDSARTEAADTTDPAVATRLIDRIADEVGPPDVLVNTIGALRPETRSPRLPRSCVS
jgi:NAD(P)-dependent dehydrogenase (short-subunit alcohol dehydrogenase family)